MPEGGSLEIKREENIEEGEYRNEYADTGEGISEESRGRIFEPLFTTKSRSVDLGVALCRRYVEVHGGEIEVESEVGKGVRLL